MAEWQGDGFENHWEKSHAGSSPAPAAMFKFFKKNKEPKDLKKVLKEFEELKKEVEKLREQGVFSVQKVGVVRYNPFSEVGGDQSFSIALLDGNNDGVVITSLYSRDGNRVYGKLVKNGKSEYSLSGEEKKAISEATGSK